MIGHYRPNRIDVIDYILPLLSIFYSLELPMVLTTSLGLVYETVDYPMIRYPLKGKFPDSLLYGRIH